MNGPVAHKMAAAMERASWIRKMFEEGARLKAERGADRVFDFTLGNPVGEPPEQVAALLARLAALPEPGSHRYMANAGLPEVRAKVAAHLAVRSGLPVEGRHVLMTVGAGGALNTILKAILDPGDEVVIVAPYFAEYLFYIDNHGGQVRIAKTGPDFQVSATELERALGPATRAVIVNSPNNPTGAVYSGAALREVGELLDRHSRAVGRPVYLIMDEPYRKLTYDGVDVPDPFNCYNRTIVATSHSKDLNLPGERIGYLAVHPAIEGADRLMDALTMAHRILGFVNAPALFQKVAAESQEALPDMTLYVANRRILCDGLAAAGYEFTEPEGGFYLFPKAPGAGDEFRFVDLLKERGVLVVPGTGFGWPGHFRIAFCCDTDTCRNALPHFAEAAAVMRG